MEWIGFGFDLDLIWIEIGVFKNFKECARLPCNGNHFSSSVRSVVVTPRRNLPSIRLSINEVEQSDLVKHDKV